MCGILAQFELEQPVDQGRFHDALTRLAHRGPDGEGIEYFQNGTVALGHRRLAIIDLSQNGRQPISNERGDVWVTYNGEIYNYLLLRRELESNGHVFRSNCDAEVIVHAYEQWGEGCVRRFRGIFAFVIWDGRSRRLFAARDHLGVKPLYYWKHDQGIIIASQPRAIITDPRCSLALDEESFYHLLSYRYMPRDRSVYSSIQKLPAAHTLTVDSTKIATQRYWEVEYRPEITDESEARGVVQEKLGEAVRSQLMSDVPLGVFLSGGIDSSAVAALAMQNCDKAIPSFTMGMDVEGYDERAYARIASDLIGTNYHEQLATRDWFVQKIPQYIAMYDEPFFDYSGIFVEQLSAMARRQGVEVILAGDGGDELFAGYKWYDKCAKAGKGNVLSRLLPPGRTLARTFLKQVGVLDQKTQTRLTGRSAPDPLQAFLAYCDSNRDNVTNAQLFDLHNFLVEDILFKVDHASMAQGVEVRVPFLDHELVELAFRIDVDLHYANNERKSLLKKAVSSYVPTEILTARKKGFGAPLGEWNILPIAKRFVPNGVLVSQNLFTSDGVEHVLSSRRANAVWLITAMELWARHWLQGDPIDAEDICEPFFDHKN